MDSVLSTVVQELEDAGRRTDAYAILKLQHEAADMQARLVAYDELLLQCVICWKPQVSHTGVREGHAFERHPRAPVVPPPIRNRKTDVLAADAVEAFRTLLDHQAICAGYCGDGEHRRLETEMYEKWSDALAYVQPACSGCRERCDVEEIPNGL